MSPTWTCGSGSIVARVLLTRHGGEPILLGVTTPISTDESAVSGTDSGGSTSLLTRTFSSLQHGQYRLLWFGMLASFMGMQMNIVARGYLAYDLAGAAIALGFVQVARAVPQLAFSMLGGVTADRFDRRKVLMVTQGTAGTVAVINATLVLTGVVQVWHLAALGVIEGTLFAFNMPARQAIIAELVPREAIPNAVALNNTGMNMCRVLGPSLAGLLIGVSAVGIGGVFVMIAVLYLLVVVTLFGLRPTPIERPEIAEDGGLRITGGVRYIQARPLLMTLFAMGFIPILLGMPYQTLLPAFAGNVLDVGSAGLGLMYTASGAGALIGSLVVAYLADSPRKTQFQMLFGVGFALSLGAFALSSAFPVSLGLLFVVGMTGQGYTSLNNTLVMLNTESHMFGRVLSVYFMTWGLMPLASLPLAALVDSIGAAPTMSGAALCILAFMFYVQAFRPEYRRMRTDPVPLG